VYLFDQYGFVLILNYVIYSCLPELIVLVLLLFVLNTCLLFLFIDRGIWTFA